MGWTTYYFGSSRRWVFDALAPPGASLLALLRWVFDFARVPFWECLKGKSNGFAYLETTIDAKVCSEIYRLCFAYNFPRKLP